MDEKEKTSQNQEPGTSQLLENNSSATASDKTLSLLKSWGRLGEHPELWPEVCREWAQRQDDSETIKRAKPLLSRIFFRNSEKEEEAKSALDESIRLHGESVRRLTLVVDSNGIVEFIGDDAMEILGFHDGDFLEEALIEPLSELFHIAGGLNDKAYFTEIVGRDGARRLVRLNPAEEDVAAENYLKITICHAFIPPVVIKYLREKILLTEAEINILTRTIQRQSIQIIARERGSAVTTVRTHIKNIIHKFGCHSLSDVTARTLEIIAYHSSDTLPSLDHAGPLPTRRGSTTVELHSRAAQIEYTAYNLDNAKPLVILHSLEYGYFPPDNFIRQARHAGYAIYTPMRPGFGQSSAPSTARDAAAMLDEFMDRLGLQDVTLVSLSTATPVALHLVDNNPRIAQTVIVNYALNATGKLDSIKPEWLKGMLDIGLGSKQSFTFAWGLTLKMLRAIGYERFYKMLYDGRSEDYAYLCEHLDEFSKTAELMLTVNKTSARVDIVNSFRPSPFADKILRTLNDAIVISGENNHGASLTPAIEQAEQYGLPFFTMQHAGRNCVYHRPELFFSLLEKHEMRATA